MKISYIVTVKNGEDFIVSCIESLENQQKVSLEVVIIDDGSEDSTVSLVRDYITNNPKVNCNLVETDGVGRAKALDLGVRLASHDLIGILDVDDDIHPMKSFYQIKHLQNLPKKTLLFTGYKKVIGSQDADFDCVDNEQLDVSNHYSLRDLIKRNPLCHSSLVFRKEDYLSINGYNLGINKLIDYELYLRSKVNGFKVICMASKMTAKRIHQAQSFEGRKRFSYIGATFRLQISYALSTNNLSLVPYVFAKLLYSLLPVSLRSKINIDK